MLNFFEILQFLWTFSTAVFGARRTPVRLTPRRTTLLAQICLSPKKGAVSNLHLRQPLFRMFKISAAAAEQKDYSDDDEPDRAVVKKVAKTVIHNRTSVVNIKSLALSIL